MRNRLARMGGVAAVAALALAGCGRKTAVLPDDPLARTASCGVIAAASERGAAGVKGDLPADAQERIFHYPLLAGSTGPSFDSDAAQAVFQRMPGLFDTTIKGKWQTLKPACAAAFPAAGNAAPALPTVPLDSMLQCYVLVDFMRKALGGEGMPAAYGETVNGYGVFNDKLDLKLAPALAKAGIKGQDAVQKRRQEALAAAAKLGQPPAVIKLCQARYT